MVLRQVNDESEIIYLVELHINFNILKFYVRFVYSYDIGMPSGYDGTHEGKDYHIGTTPVFTEYAAHLLIPELPRS